VPRYRAEQVERFSIRDKRDRPDCYKSQSGTAGIGGRGGAHTARKDRSIEDESGAIIDRNNGGHSNTRTAKHERACRYGTSHRAQRCVDAAA
jgi:hypothetical protein